MKAVLFTRYGSLNGIKLSELEKPIPKDKQVLIKVRAASLNAVDWRGMKSNGLLNRLMGGGFLKPKDGRLGSDVAGIVAAVGENVTGFRPGDEVFGCSKGTFAEFVLAKEANLASKPANRTFEEAAAVPVAALTALQAFRAAPEIQPGQSVAIQGASGGVGIFSVQLAKYYGAEVTAVCSTRNLDLMRSLGADHGIDYTREDFTRHQAAYDLILAVNGYHSLSAYKRSLKPHGVYVCVGGDLAQFFQVMALGKWMSRKGDKKLVSMGISKVNSEDLICLGQLLETGKIVPFIDRTYGLSEVPEAIRYVMEKHPQGKVVISIP